MEYSKPLVIGHWGTGNSHQRRLIYSTKHISPTVQAAWGMGGGNCPSVLVTPNTPKVYYCRGCDNMYIWTNNALSAVPLNLTPLSIMPVATKTANTHHVRSARKSQETNQSSKNGGRNNDTTQNTEIESREGTQE